jgi:hypothetical protein
MSGSLEQSVDPFGLKPFVPSGPAPADAVLVSVRQDGADGPNESETFDPFGIADDQSMWVAADDAGATATNVSPKLVVKLARHEEVASVARADAVCEGASDCSIQGTIYAMAKGSDPEKTLPFRIPFPELPETFSIHPQEPHSSIKVDDNNNRSLIVSLSKDQEGFVPVLHYSGLQYVQHMPILLERKITIQDTSCRVAAQVRSKLTNMGDIEDFTVAIAIPEAVDGSSIDILRGDGVWFPTQRLIKFKLSALTHGESFMVCAQMKLWKPVTGNDDSLTFPVLLRCSSADDPICEINFQVLESEEAPAFVTQTATTNAFRLLHRLT